MTTFRHKPFTTGLTAWESFLDYQSQKNPGFAEMPAPLLELSKKTFLSGYTAGIAACLQHETAASVTADLDEVSEAVAR